MKILMISVLILLGGCASFHGKNETSNATVLKSPNGNSSITLWDDGTVEMKGTRILIESDGRLVLQGKSLEMNTGQ